MNRYLMTVMLVFTGVRAATAETYVVSPNFPDRIQVLIDLVVTDGDVIQLEAGTYLIDEPIDPNGLAITLRGVQDPSSNTPLTILDGQFKTRIVNCASEEDEDTVFEWIEFTRGFRGGFVALGASPTIQSCVFRQNNYETGDAGAVIIFGHSLVRNTLFDDNRGQSGAIYFPDNSHSVVANCTFVRNERTASNGAGAINAPGSVEFINCRICENDAPQVSTFVDTSRSTITDLCGCLADTNYDNKVDGTDIGVLFALWGTGNPLADFNKDGIADGIDLGILVGAWGDCPPFCGASGDCPPF